MRLASKSFLSLLLLAVTLVLTPVGAHAAQDPLLRSFSTGANISNYPALWVRSHEQIGQNFNHSSSMSVSSVRLKLGTAMSYDGNAQYPYQPVFEVPTMVQFWAGNPQTGFLGGVWMDQTAKFNSVDHVTELKGSPIFLPSGNSTIVFFFGDMGTFYAPWSDQVEDKMLTRPLVPNSDGGTLYARSSSSAPWSTSTSSSLVLEVYGNSSATGPQGGNQATAPPEEVIYASTEEAVGVVLQNRQALLNLTLAAWKAGEYVPMNYCTSPNYDNLTSATLSALQDHWSLWAMTDIVNYAPGAASVVLSSSYEDIGSSLASFFGGYATGGDYTSWRNFFPHGSDNKPNMGFGALTYNGVRSLLIQDDVCGF